MPFSFKRQLIIATFAVLPLLFHTACGNRDGSGEPTVGLSASLNSTDYTVTGLSIFDKIWESIYAKSVFAVGETVNEVWALPLYNGEFHPSVFAYAKRATVTSSGFELTLEKRNWVLILLNTSAASRADQVVGYVAMTVGDFGLQNIPLEAASGNLSLGELTRSGTETRSSKTAEDNSATVGVTTANLLAMAKSDDTLKVIKNSYRNYNGSLFTTIKPFFAWSKSTIGTSINNTYSSPASTIASDFKGYLFYMNSNDLSTVSFSRICAGSDTMTLLPPTSVTNNSATKTFSPGDPFSSAYGTGSGQSGTSCGVGTNLYIRDDSATYSSVQFNFSANVSGGSNGYLAPPIPSGDWTLKVNSTTVASFEGNLGNPFESNDTTKPIVPVPAIQATVSGSTISSVQLKWYQRAIGGSTYTEITDATQLAQLSSVAIGLTDYGVSPRRDEMSSTLTTSTGYSFTPSTYTWGTTSGVSISVSFTIFGVAYYYDWRY